MIFSNFTQRGWQGFLALCLCLFALPALAVTDAAVVLFSHGTATKVSGAERLPLTKGDQLEAGDTVNTGHDGRVQMRFTDGGLVSLMPNSSFAIDRYNQPDTQDGGSLSFRLMKGGLRTITGSIGQKNHDNYELKTDVATLGIRGTEFVVVIDGDAMRVHVNEGLIALQNQLGDLMVPAGQNAVVFPQQAPTLSDTAPLFISSTATNGDGTTQTTAASSPTDSSPIASSNQPNDSLSQSLPAQTMLSPAEQEIFSQHMQSTGTQGPQPGGTPVTPPVDGGGFAFAEVNNNGVSSSSYTQSMLTDQGVNTFDEATSTYINSDLAANAQLAGSLFWSSFEDTVNYTHNYAVWGTPATQLPTTGTLNYTLVEQQNNADPSYPGDLTRFDLAINLDSNTTFDVAMEFDEAYMSFSESNLPGTLKGSSFDINQFNTTDPLGYCDSNGCSVDIAGVLSGNAGSQAAAVYNIKGTDINFNGAAILDKQ